VNDVPVSSPVAPPNVLGRRGFLQIGGVSVAMAAVVAACGGNDGGGLARVGNAPTTTALPDPIINDVVLLRTASSLEHSMVGFFDLVIDDPKLLDPSHNDLVKRLRDDHTGHAALFEQLTSDAGGEPWACTNPRVDDFVIGPVLKAINGAPKTEDTAEVPPSDDAKRDILNFIHGLESMAAATYQAMVSTLSEPSLRKESVGVGVNAARHAAWLALVITGRPTGYLPPSEAPADPPPFPIAYAIPSTYGLLGAQQLVLGAPNETGVRASISLDTPSLNTFLYESITPSC
jgi:Ferritin-like domain